MKKVIILIGTILLFPLFIYYSKDVAQGVLNGVKLCFYTILPSLYIFTVLSIFCVNAELLMGIKTLRFVSRIFNLNESCCNTLILSLFCGYPVGAKLFNELYKQNLLTEKTAELLLCLSINAGPGFVISAIGICLYKSKTTGLILFISAIITPLLLTLVFRKRFVCYKTLNSKTVNYTSCFINAVNNANKTLASICGWVILGSVAVRFAEKLSNLTFLAYFLEVSVGVTEASKLSIYLVSFLVGFGGICVHLQAISAAPNIKPRFFMIFIIKFISGLINLAITYILLKVFKVSLATVNINNLNLESGQTTPLASIVLMLFIMTTLAFLQRKIKKYGKRQHNVIQCIYN